MLARFVCLISLVDALSPRSGAYQALDAEESGYDPNKTLCVRQPFIGGNWKCYGDSSVTGELVKALNSVSIPSDSVEVRVT